MFQLILSGIIFILIKGAFGFKSSIELYQYLLINENYNKLIRPVEKNDDAVTTYVGLRLTQLLDLNLRDQMLTTNIWLLQEWQDVNLRWNPDDYGGVKLLHIPPNKIWRPDLVLYNNADGKFEATLMTKAKVFYNGTVNWKTPAVYRSSCLIDVEFFPYDIQTCDMTFASWTYNGNKMILKHYAQRGIPDTVNTSGTVKIDFAVDLRHFYISEAFDILELSAVRNIKHYRCCPEPFPEVTFRIVLRRKTLFYTVNLMIPCLAMSYLTGLVFYLPAQSGEKIMFSLSILLSLTLFFLILVETIPSTSLVIPLIGKYLLFTIILISISIIVTVIVLNVNFRSSMTHTMPKWVRKLFVEFLPRYLFLSRLARKQEENVSCLIYSNAATSSVSQAIQNLRKLSAKSGDIENKLDEAIKGVNFIVKHLQEKDETEDVQQEWKFIAVVLDRLLLLIFLVAYVISAFGIIFRSPALFDMRIPLDNRNLPNKTTLTFISQFHENIITIDTH